VGLATSPSTTANQPIGGIAISATGLVTANGLGAMPGTVIYGYSLFAPDVSGTGGQVLTNPSTFPLNTNSTTGGIDLIGNTGAVFQAIVPFIEIPTLIIPDGVVVREIAHECGIRNSEKTGRDRPIEGLRIVCRGAHCQPCDAVDLARVGDGKGGTRRKSDVACTRNGLRRTWRGRYSGLQCRNVGRIDDLGINARR
jgi:hypothetical protein